MEGNLDIVFVIGFMWLMCLVAIWNNWIYHNYDCFSLERRPHIFMFYGMGVYNLLRFCVGKDIIGFRELKYCKSRGPE